MTLGICSTLITAGIAQLFSEFCNITQLDLIFLNLNVHPAVNAVASSEIAFSALGNNLRRNVEGEGEDKTLML